MLTASPLAGTLFSSPAIMYLLLRDGLHRPEKLRRQAVALPRAEEGLHPRIVLGDEVNSPIRHAAEEMPGNLAGQIVEWRRDEVPGIFRVNVNDIDVRRQRLGGGKGILVRVSQIVTVLPVGEVKRVQTEPPALRLALGGDLRRCQSETRMDLNEVAAHGTQPRIDSTVEFMVDETDVLIQESISHPLALLFIGKEQPVHDPARFAGAARPVAQSMPESRHGIPGPFVVTDWAQNSAACRCSPHRQELHEIVAELKSLPDQLLWLGHHGAECEPPLWPHAHTHQRNDTDPKSNSDVFCQRFVPLPLSATGPRPVRCTISV